MDTINQIANFIHTNHLAFSLLLVAIFIFTGLLFYKQVIMEKFAQFTDAPIAYQTSTGWGTNAKYQFEDSATNRSASNIWNSAVNGGTENMIGYSEPPVFYQTSKALDSYQYNQGKTMKPEPKESFRSGGLFTESFGNNGSSVESKLNDILHQ